MVAPARCPKEGREIFYHRNLAHRGLHTPDKQTPENSLAAFAAAADAGYGIELDLQFSKDEQIVVFHDDDLRRVCGLNKRVDELDYEELKKLSLCGTDQRIPLFTEVLELVDGRVPLLVEFKNGPKNNLLCEKTLPLLRAYKGDFCIESFTPFIVRWFRKNAPDIMRGQLSASKEEFGDAVGSKAATFLLSHCWTNVMARPHFIAYHTKKTYLSVKLAERLGAMRFVWTVRPANKPEDQEKKNDCVIFEHYKPGIRY